MAGVSALVDVGGVHDAFHVERGHPVTRQRAGVFVGDNNYFDTKSGVASTLGGRGIESAGFLDLVDACRLEPQHCAQSQLFFCAEVRRCFDQHALGFVPERRVSQANEKGRIEADLHCEIPVRRRLAIGHQRLPDTGSLEVMERQTQFERWPFAVGDD